MTPSRQFIPASQAQRPCFVGVDLGGTNIKAGVVDDLGRAMSWHSSPSETERGPEDGARRMGLAVHRAIRDAQLRPDDIAGVGLGTPGTQDIKAGMLLEPPNLQGWENFPIRERVAEHCKLPVTFANDANAAAYGEFWVGRGHDYDSLVLLTLGTGIGCGIVIGGRVVEGEHSHGGECGHIIIDYHENARLCPCGQPGHLEAYCSAIAIVKRTREELDVGKETSLTARLTAGEELTPLILAEEAAAGDELSHEIIMETARYLGVGIVTIIHTIDPNGVVLGGAMTFGENETVLGRQFLDRVREEVVRRAFPVLVKNVKIEYATLGGDAGFIGAAGLARRSYKKVN